MYYSRRVTNSYLKTIAILPILLNLFSRVLYARVEGYLFRDQSVDQAGFKPGFSCDDHLFTVTMVYEKRREWNIPVWCAAIDYKNAFDRVDHLYLWQAMEDASVPWQYIDVLRRLYSNQTGVVIADKQSRGFKILRGTKQGDSISPPLFNAVLERIMKKIKPLWKREKPGLDLGDGHCLQNLRFADDVLLFGTSLKQVERMINTNLVEESVKAGLQLHPGKANVLGNVRKRRGYNCKQQMLINALLSRCQNSWAEQDIWVGFLPSEVFVTLKSIIESRRHGADFTVSEKSYAPKTFR